MNASTAARSRWEGSSAFLEGTIVINFLLDFVAVPFRAQQKSYRERRRTYERQRESVSNWRTQAQLQLCLRLSESWELRLNFPKPVGLSRLHFLPWRLSSRQLGKWQLWTQAHVIPGFAVCAELWATASQNSKRLPGIWSSHASSPLLPLNQESRFFKFD